MTKKLHIVAVLAMLVAALLPQDATNCTSSGVAYADAPCVGHLSHPSGLGG